MNTDHGARVEGGGPERTRPRFVATLIMYLCAVLLVGVSFAAYASRFSPVDRWAADNYDPADYRFIAEYFWNVPFEPDTYDEIWHGGWGDYLRVIPFRTIGLGSLHLLVGWVQHGRAPATTAEVVTAGIALAYLQKVLLAAALLILFGVVRRRWGTALAFLTLVVTAFPTHFWRISDDFLTEPVHRIVFLLAFACAVAIGGREWPVSAARSREALALALVGLLLIATHLKVQWYLGALLLLPVILFDFRRAGAPRRSMLRLSVATLLVPVSVIAVHWIGWRDTSLSPGIGLHVNLRYDGDVLREFTALSARGATPRPPFADPDRPKLRWWEIYVGPDVSRDEYKAFDRFAREYMWARPRSMAGNFWEGLTLASTVPGIERLRDGRIRIEPVGEPWSTVVRFLDLAVWVLLVVGLAFDRTRLPSALGLILWIVPAAGNVVSLYEARYHLPMAGLGAAASACVLTTLARVGLPLTGASRRRRTGADWASRSPQ